MNSPFIDISVRIAPGIIPVWPGVSQPKIESRLSITKGDCVNDSNLSFNLHTGTHIDLPSHFFEDGADSDTLELSKLIGPCEVLDLRGRSVISIEDLQKIKPNTQRVLFKTDNSGRWNESEFFENFIGLNLEAAHWLAERKFLMIGNDYLSVQPYKASNEIHKVLLNRGVVLLEGIDLSSVEGGFYDLICLPLKIGAVEGLPARAILSTKTFL